MALSCPARHRGAPARTPARPLLDAWHEGAAALPAEFGAWAAPCLSEPDPAELASLLDRGFAGACLPAEALATAAGFDALRPACSSCSRQRGAPLFVHPGPAPGTLRGAAIAAADASVPSWWPAAHQLRGRDERGLARVRALRPARAPASCGSASRCWPASRRSTASGWSRAAAEPAADPDAFLDTSSYGPRAVDAVIRELGVDALTYGSDRPVVPAAEPGAGRGRRMWRCGSATPPACSSLAEVAA